jgi:cytosine deaminase
MAKDEPRMPVFDLLITNARLPDQSLHMIGVRNGRIVSLDPPEGFDTATETIDIGGRLVLPGLVDGHNHLDTNFLRDVWRSHEPCKDGFNVGERLAIQKKWVMSGAPVEARAAALVERAVSRGTTSMRTHVEIDPDFGLHHLEAILAVRDRYRRAVSIEIVALARGLLVRPGVMELMQAALASGADIVGGLDPAGFEMNVDRHLDGVFALAERYGKGIDLHLHDGGHLGLHTLEQMARRTRAAGLEGQVVASHAYALGEVPLEAMQRTADNLARAGISIMTNAPGDHPFPPVLPLIAAGVNVFAGNDDIRDSWWPYGDGDMLERAMMIGYRSGFFTDDELLVALDMTTANAAQALQLGDYGLKTGAAADFVVVEAANPQEAVVARPIRWAVFKAGRMSARDGVFNPGALR